MNEFIRIHKLTRDDICEAVGLRALCWVEETAGNTAEQPDIEKEIAFYSNWMVDADKYDDVRLLYGAFDGEKMLGVAFGSFVESKNTPEAGFELNGLWVYPEYRGIGISLRLLLALFCDFQRLGAEKMVVYNYHCAPSNSFYRHFGCKVIDTEYQTKDRILTDILEGLLSVLIPAVSASLSHKKIYPYGYCGMPCALCSRYRTNGSSRCTGCSADGYYTDVCKVHHCCRDMKLKHCGECEAFPCARLGKMSDFRDLDTGNIKQKHCADISENGFVGWYCEYIEKADLLTSALEKYNNGRMKRYLCELFIKQDLSLLRDLMTKAEDIICTNNEKPAAFKRLADKLCAKD